MTVDEVGRPGSESALEGIRGLAAVMVFLYHLRWIAHQPALMFAGVNLQLILQRFDYGVCLFFVLSGYLLSTPYWAALRTGVWPDWQKYALRRVGRIMPALWSALLAIALLSPSTYTFWGGVSLLLQAVGLHTLIDVSYAGCVPVLWSIGVEIQYYTLLPLLFRASAFVGRRRFWSSAIALGGCVLLLSPIWRLATLRLLPFVPEKIFSGPESSAINGSVFHYFLWFGAGIATRVLPKHFHRESNAVWNGCFLLSVATFIAGVLNSTEGQWRTVSAWGWPFSAVACALLIYTSPRSELARSVFDNSMMRFLGSISYGIYLWHIPVEKAVFGGTLPARLGGAAGFVIGGIIALFVTCLIAWLSHVVLEKPAMTWAKRQSSIRAAISTLTGTSNRVTAMAVERFHPAPSLSDGLSGEPRAL